MLGPRQTMQESMFYGFSLESHVPNDHLLRRIDALVDPRDPYAYFKVPDGYRTLACAHGTPAQRRTCANYRRSAGYPISHNENLAMMRALAEMALAADSQLYRTSAAAHPLLLFVATNTAPQLIARNFAYFDAQLHADDEDGAPTFTWNHQHVPGHRRSD